MRDDAKEIITITNSEKFSDIKTVVDDIVRNIEDGSKNYISNVGKNNNPFYGKVVREQSANGKQGFRVDYDTSKGAHINWWNGKQKGAMHFNGDFEQVKRIVNNEVFK